MEILTYWANYPTLQGYDQYTYALDDREIEDVQVTHPNVNPHEKRMTRVIGDTWVEEQRSLALRVPSVVLPRSFNFLINPNHPAYDAGRTRSLGPFEYDQRITALLEQARRQKE